MNPYPPARPVDKNPPKRPLKKWATAGWLVILAGMIDVEFGVWLPAKLAELTELDPWTVLFFSVLVWELVGIIVPGTGDLGTDNIRAFTRGGIARAGLVAGVVVWVCARFAYAGFMGGGPFWPRLVLAAGAALWLIPHFVRHDGEWG